MITKYNGQLLTLGMPEQYPASLQFDFSWRAGVSLGNNYFSFISGRYPFSLGTSVTGNLIAGDNFTYQEIAMATFMNNYFTYSLSLTNFDQQNHHFTYIDMSEVVFDDNDGRNPSQTPSGPMENVEHMLRLALTFTYTFDVPNLELYLGLASHIYTGITRATGVFRPQAMIDVKWTGIDNSWWKKYFLFVNSLR